MPRHRQGQGVVTGGDNWHPGPGAVVQRQDGVVGAGCTPRGWGMGRGQGHIRHREGRLGAPRSSGGSGGLCVHCRMDGCWATRMQGAEGSPERPSAMLGRVSVAALPSVHLSLWSWPDPKGRALCPHTWGHPAWYLHLWHNCSQKRKLRLERAG